MDKTKLEKALHLARVATQDNPGFAIVDARKGYARYPTEEEILMGEILLGLWEGQKTVGFVGKLVNL